MTTDHTILYNRLVLGQYTKIANKKCFYEPAVKELMFKTVSKYIWYWHYSC